MIFFYTYITIIIYILSEKTRRNSNLLYTNTRIEGIYTKTRKHLSEE